MNENFLLILKVNNYMNNIDKKLGMPINNYYYTTKYSLKSFYKHCLYNETYWIKFKFMTLYYFTLLKFILLDVYLKAKSHFN